MKGICFKEPLFHKVVDGTKTQTRRIIVNQPDARGFRVTNVPFEDWHGRERKPKYQPGEIIYLKEPYNLIRKYPNATGENSKIYIPHYAYNKQAHLRIMKLWKNKLFMPEKYARHFIQITDVTAQRLQEITEADAIMEGFTGISSFQSTWISIHGFKSWPDNPWVWKYVFERQAVTEGLISFILNSK